MKRMIKVFMVASLLSYLLCPSLQRQALTGDRAQVTVSILPQKYFLEQIGGEQVDVSVMVLPGANPATYEPRPRQMAKLTESKAYFAVGAPFETHWLAKFASFNPGMEIVHTQAGIAKLRMMSHHHEEGKGGHGSEGRGEVLDPHIWLSPPLVMLQARNILEGLLKIAPEHRDLFEANYRKFIHEIVDLDLSIMARFKDRAQGSRFMVYHPAWGYFARAYGLEQVPVEMEGKEPSPRELQHLIELARKDGIKVIFVQPQFSEKSADTIARAIGGKVMAADPLAQNWADNLEKVSAVFAEVLR
jgi:zinc transport system substrate-binding protein